MTTTTPPKEGTVAPRLANRNTDSAMNHDKQRELLFSDEPWRLVSEETKAPAPARRVAKRQVSDDPPAWELVTTSTPKAKA